MSQNQHLELQTTTTVSDYLKFIASSRRQFGRLPTEWQYSCLEEFVLLNGTSYTNKMSRPKWVPKGAIKECFSNCFNAIIRHPNKLVYCEGYATALIPVHHAWLLYDGKIIDPTWDAQKIDAVEYFGIAFNYEYVVQTAINTGYYSVLDNFAQHHPLIKGEHNPADFLHDAQ